MSEFIIVCPNCGQEYRLNDIQGLIKAECENCGEVFIVEQPYKVVKPKQQVIEERVITVKSDNEHVEKIEEELKKVKKDTSVIAFVCWPIAISMVLGFIGLIIKGLIAACAVGAATCRGDSAGLIAGILILLGIVVILMFVWKVSDDDASPWNEDAELRYKDYLHPENKEDVCKAFIEMKEEKKEEEKKSECLWEYSGATFTK